MTVHISGSIAFDRIMNFQGHFEDHILPDKLHILNVSFMMDSIEERKGGTAGNIAYNLCLLGEKPRVYAAVGRDFIGSYQHFLEKLGVIMDGIKIHEHSLTACAHITTDSKGNQITGFAPAAMSNPLPDEDFPKLSKNDIGIVSPGNLSDMSSLPRYFKEKGCPYIFDPGQQIPVIKKEDFREAIEGAFILIGNDYEIEMICNATDCSKEELLKSAEYVITTLGENGCLITHGTEAVNIEAVRNITALDPTGAGDAFRAGLIYGLGQGLSMEISAKLGSICASFTIEHVGTQEHVFDYRIFKERYENTYGTIPIAQF